MSNFYSKISEQNPEVKAAFEKAFAKNGVVFSIELINILTAAVVTACVGKSLGSVIQKSGVSTATRIGTDLSINLHRGAVTVGATAAIKGDFTVSQTVAAMVAAFGSTAADMAIGTLGLSLGPEIIMAAVASVAITALVTEGVEGYMDVNAIVEAQKYGSYLIRSASGLNEFLSERWEHVRDFKRWSLQKADDETSLKLTFSKTEGSTSPASLEINQSTYLPNENPELFETICRKIATDFDLKIQGEPIDRIHNYFGKDIAGLVEAANTQAGLFAMQHLAPFVAKNKAGSEYQNIELKSYSDQYKTDRARFLFYRINPGERVFDNKETILFEDLALAKSGDGFNGYDHASAYRNPNSPAGNIRKYTFGTDGNDSIDGHLYDDHLYGEKGNDTLKGYHGDDYFEGGKGQDSMDGGQGNDTFFVMGEDDHYDVFKGGSGEDTILGSKKSDTIRVHNFEGDECGEDNDDFIFNNSIISSIGLISGESGGECL